MLPYMMPFALFIGLSYLGTLFENGIYYMYPIKTIIVGMSLFYYRKHYSELYQKINFKSITIAIFVGVLVFIIWVLPEGFYPTIGASEFNPYRFESQSFIIFLIAFRIIGASVVVPVFEELFWRSFLIRWIVNQDFKKVPLGKFTWFSFGLTVLFFGLEHDRWLVGIFAGVIYNGLLYKEKNIMPCIIAHALTNLILGIYVLITQQWGFW
jgi:CAAX prenyl protease-like protein